ncbi:MAG: universal stress protein [Cyclobacteriaceae bacterium]
MRILIPADFTDVSKRAAAYGAALAEKTGAEIYLIHVHKPSVSRNNLVYPLEADMHKDIKRETGLQLGEYYKELFREPYSRISGITRVGKTADEIVLEAARVTNSLIVMGTHSDGSIKQWINGSETAEVIEKTEGPVLVIPSEGKAGIPGKIAFLTGCDSYDLIALEKVVSLTGKLNADLFLVHVSADGKNGDRQVFQDFCNRVKLQTGYEKIYSQMVKDKDVINGIRRYTETHKPDLLAFNVRSKVLKKRLFQKPFTQIISTITGLPLLIFHRP